MPFIANLESLRLSLHLSQAKFARLAKIDRETVSRCENCFSIQSLSCAKISDGLIGAGIPAERIILDKGGKSGSQGKKGKARLATSSEKVTTDDDVPSPVEPK